MPYMDRKAACKLPSARTRHSLCSHSTEIFCGMNPPLNTHTAPSWKPNDQSMAMPFGALFVFSDAYLHPLFHSVPANFIKFTRGMRKSCKQSAGLIITANVADAAAVKSTRLTQFWNISPVALAERTSPTPYHVSRPHLADPNQVTGA